MKGGEGVRLFLACKPQQRLMMVYQREFFPKSSLQPEAPTTVPALPEGCRLVGTGRFGPRAPPGSGRKVCGDGGTVQGCSGQALAGLDWSTRYHTVLPEASGEVQDPLGTSGQMLVTQPSPVTASLLLQPSKNAVRRLRSRNPPS